MHCLKLFQYSFLLFIEYESERALDIVWGAPHHHNCFMALFLGPPGWAGARRELLDFMVQGKINRGRHTDHPAGRHSIRTNQCLPPPSAPIFFTGQMLFLPPNQQHQSTKGNLCIRIREKTLEFSSTVLPAPSLYHIVLSSTLLKMLFKKQSVSQ